MSIHKNDIENLVGAAVIGPDGDKIGDVRQFYLSDTTGEPTWATVKTGLFGTQESFVPLSGSSVQPDELRVAFDKATVKDAPRVDVDGHLSLEEEAELYRYYGIDDEDRGVRETERSEGRVVGDADSVHDDVAGERGAEGGWVPAGGDPVIGGDGTPDRNRDVVDNRDDDGLTRPDGGEEVRSRTSDSDRDAGLDAVTPGETRTRMRRYVVTEHVTQTIEELPDDNDRT